MANGLEKGGKTLRNSIERLFSDNQAFTAEQKVKQKATRKPPKVTMSEMAEVAEKMNDRDER